MRESDYIYFRRRAAEERSAAEATSNLAAARAHKAMAERYASMAQFGTVEIAAESRMANDS